MFRRRLLLLLPGFAALAAFAQSPSPPPAAAEPDPAATPAVTNLRGIFDFDLPTLDPPGTMKLTLHPHLGDLVRRDYMRFEGGVRWALNDHFELRPEATVYFTHGLGGGDGGYGVGELRLAGKYIIRGWPDPDMETSLSLNVEVPVGHPPGDLTDGFNHIAPGFLVQHRSSHRPKLTTFAGAGLDLVSTSSIAGTPVRNQPLDDSANFTAGAIYDLGQIKWTLSATYATTAGLGDHAGHFYYLRPSLLWYVPRRLTFHSKTQWILGLGIRASYGPDGTRISLYNRVRAEITFRQFMANMRDRRKAGISR